MLYKIWIIAIIIFGAAWIFRRWMFNAHYILCVVVDRVKSSLRRFRDWFLDLIDPTFPVCRKGPKLDESEDFWHRDS